MDLPQHTRDRYCQTSERAERDYMFPPYDEATLVSELERVQNQCAEQDSLHSSERPHPLVNYSSTDDSESDLPQSNGYISDDEDIPSDEHQSGQMAQQTLQSK